MSYSTWMICLAFLVFGTLSRAEEATHRTFTDRQGRQIQAKVISKKGDDFIVERKGGKRFLLKTDTLSDKDQAFLKKWKAPKADLAFDVKCNKKLSDSNPVEDDPFGQLGGGTKTSSKGYCYEITLTNKSFEAMPKLEVRYQLFKSISGGLRNGKAISPAGGGKLSFAEIERLKSASLDTITVVASKSTTRSTSLNSDGTTDKSYTKTREALAGILVEIFDDDKLVKRHTHGRVIDKKGK